MNCPKEMCSLDNRVHYYKVCIKSPCTVSAALLALIEVHGLLIQTLASDMTSLVKT